MALPVRLRHVVATRQKILNTRSLSSATERFSGAQPRRSYLYVPSSNPKMLAKSAESPSDTIIFDLEDSVGPDQKPSARQQLVQFLERTSSVRPSKYAIRINSLDTEYFSQDIATVLSKSAVETVVLPKVHSAQDLDTIAEHIPSGRRVQLVASIESARALWAIEGIATWKHPSASVVALLFAAEDYCADTSIQRSRSRSELLYTRSRIVSAAKAFGLQSIDMVCVNYKDAEYLEEECQDGRRLGYDGKQAIHPIQVDSIQRAFAPTEKEIERASKILVGMERARKSEARGAFGLELPGGGKEMIDEPMVKQAHSTIAKARAAGLSIPDFVS